MSLTAMRAANAAVEPPLHKSASCPHPTASSMDPWRTYILGPPPPCLVGAVLDAARLVLVAGVMSSNCVRTLATLIVATVYIQGKRIPLPVSVYSSPVHGRLTVADVGLGVPTSDLQWDSRPHRHSLLRRSGGHGR